MSFLLFTADWLRRLSIFTGATVPLVATYTRELPVSIARMYENAIDGEHLPWLHSDTFATLEISDHGDWGWRGAGHLQPKSFMTWMELELRLDRNNHRWITTTLRGLGKGNQIVTHAIPLGENRIKVIVDFYVPKLPVFLHAMYGKQLVETYTKLYDEDLSMMSTRQQKIDLGKTGETNNNALQIELGGVDSIDKKLPLKFELANKTYRLVSIDGDLVAHATTCPHMLGPLQDTEVRQGQVTCPWHGYQFDVRTRRCTSGQLSELPVAPAIYVDEERGLVIAELEK